MPTANGKWIAKTIFLFNGENGANPWAGVVLEQRRQPLRYDLLGRYWRRCLNAYQRVSGCGVVFSLIPSPANGTWTENVLHSFDNNGFDGLDSFAALASDAAGNLYGTTEFGGIRGAGTVFKMTKHIDGEWTERVVYNFGRYGDGAEPGASVLFDAAGRLYGIPLWRAEASICKARFSRSHPSLPYRASRFS